MTNDNLLQKELGAPAVTGNLIESIGLKGFRTINTFSLSPLDYEDLTKDAFDKYIFLRDAYEQNRNKKIEE